MKKIFISVAALLLANNVLGRSTITEEAIEPLIVSRIMHSKAHFEGCDDDLKSLALRHTSDKKPLKPSTFEILGIDFVRFAEKRSSLQKMMLPLLQEIIKQDLALAARVLKIEESAKEEKTKKKPLIPSSTPILKGFSNAKGAGILPLAIHPDTGEVMALLGKEYVGRSNREEWIDFGGSKDPGEDAFQTASREFFEETCEIFGRPSKSSISFYSSTRGHYLTAVSPVTYKTPQVIKQEVASVRQRITKSTYNEKNDFEWIALSALIDAIKNNQTLIIKGSPVVWRFVGSRDVKMSTEHPPQISKVKNILTFFESILEKNK